MSTPNNRRRDPGGLSAEAVLVWIAVVLVVVVVGSVYAAMHLGHRFAGTGTSVPADPFSVLFGLLGGDLTWPGAAGWWVLGVMGALLLALGVLAQPVSPASVVPAAAARAEVFRKSRLLIIVVRPLSYFCAAYQAVMSSS